MLKKLLIIALFLTVTSAIFATVPAAETKRQYFTCNGSTTTYTFTAPCNSSDDIRVEKRLISTGVPTSLTEETDYTITNTGSSYLEGGVVTISPALDSTYQVVIIREIVQTQETVAGAINPVSVVAALDKLTRQIQDIRYDLNYRYLRIPQSDADTLDMQIGNSVTRANQYLSFGSTGATTISSSGFTSDDYLVSTYMEDILDDTDEAVFKSTVNLESGVDVQAYDVDLALLANNNYTADVNLVDIKTKGPVHDIRAYGALEDGVTDNAVAIQAAIDAAEQDATQERGRGVVLIPCVSGLGFQCAADIQIKDQILITGGGIIEFTSTYGFESNNKRGWVIDGITILGSEAANQTGIYIHNGSQKFWIRNNQFYNFQTGIFATKSYIFRIDDNDMYLSGATLSNIACIKLTSGEGNCSKGTAYDTVNDVKIRGNILADYGAAPNATPLIHIGDSALAPIAPQLITHAKCIDISANLLSAHLSESGVRVENIKTATIERNWFESLVGPAVYAAGQWNNNIIIRANTFWGNDNDDFMDPPIKIYSTIGWNNNKINISQNEFNQIHANHNLIEAEDAIGLILDSNHGLAADRISFTTCTGVDIRQPEWNYIFDSFTDTDATPSVKFKKIFLTVGTTTITDFDDGYTGQIITVVAETSITITDGTNIFLSGSANWAMTATDTLTLICKADNKWYEISRSDSGA